MPLVPASTDVAERDSALGTDVSEYSAAALGPIAVDLGPVDALPVLSLPDAGIDHAARIVAACEQRVELSLIPGHADDAVLAHLRDAIWPACHLTAVYRGETSGAVTRHTLGSRAHMEERFGQPLTAAPCTVLYVRLRTEAMGMANTRAKFDTTAVGWNGMPGSPTYGHYRWMRKLIADVAQPVSGLRTLDAGCGTGWVGIEAALAGAQASAFDASSAMVELAKLNAQEVGVPLDARTGFVEEVPFEDPFDLVLNSGVISFAPDADVYIERLDSLVKPGGLLVIGDINPLSRGFARRRRRTPLLPSRELNGLPRAEAQRLLEARGYTVEKAWYYQITFPVPELMAASEKKGKGLGCGLMLGLNKLAASFDSALGSPFTSLFDSWILRARKPS